MKVNALWAVALGVFAWGAQFAAQAQQNDAADGDWAAGATWGNALGHPLGETYTIDSNTVTTTTNTNFSAATSIEIATGGTLEFNTGTINNSGAARRAETDIILSGGRILTTGNPALNNNNTKTQIFDMDGGVGDSFTVSAASTIEHNATHLNNTEVIIQGFQSRDFVINDVLTIDVNNQGGRRKMIEFRNPGTLDIRDTDPDAGAGNAGLIRVLGTNANDRFRISANNAAADFEVSVPIALQSARAQFVGDNAAEILMSANITNINSSFNNSVEVNNVALTISSVGNTYQGDTVVSNNAELNVTGNISSSRNLLDNGDNRVALYGTGTVGGILFDGAMGGGVNLRQAGRTEPVSINVGDLNAGAPTPSTLTATGNVQIGSPNVLVAGANRGGQPFLTNVTVNMDLFANGSNDVLAGNGANTLNFNDILKPILQGAYAPVFGDQFQVFSNFASITLGQHFRLDTSMAVLGPGLGWDISLLQSQGILMVGAPEPGTTLPLLVLAAGLLVCYRPRRLRGEVEIEVKEGMAA